ncbi:MAG: type II toxin-antitoxin system HicB family antitoxin [Candidatus Eremiobacterota bacterium]
MLRNFTLEYWIDEDWYIGRLKEVPGVFSQAESLEELEENIKDAYILMMEAYNKNVIPGNKAQSKEIGVVI